MAELYALSILLVIHSIAEKGERGGVLVNRMILKTSLELEMVFPKLGVTNRNWLSQKNVL